MNSETIELAIVISSCVYAIVLFFIIVRKAIRYRLVNKYGYGVTFSTLEDSYILSKKEHEAIGRALTNYTKKIK